MSPRIHAAVASSVRRTSSASSSSVMRSSVTACPPRGARSVSRSRAPLDRMVGRRVERGAFGEQAWTWDVVELESDALGVAERERVVPRRPRTLLRRPDDVGADLLQELVDAVDVLAA